MLSEFWNITWQSLKPGQGTLAFVVALTPPLIWMAFLLYQVRYRADIMPPQQEKILRPAGYSLQLKLDELFESILQMLCWTSVMFLIATFGAVCAFAFFRAHLQGAKGALEYAIFFVGLFVVSISPGLTLMTRIFRKTLEARNTRLGLRGEQAVSEVLHEAGDAGYRAFHDLQPDGTWNIDHVLVGSRGVFMIETKTRCRRPPTRQQPRHVVLYNGRTLAFSSGLDTTAVPQAQRNAAWLSDFLSKKTCEPVFVEPIIVIPGWYTESTGNFPVKVMNTNYLRTYLRKLPEKIDPPQVRRIIAALDGQCRTLEF